MASNSIPPAEISHRVNDHDHGAYVIIATVFMFVTSVSFILVRLFIRWPWRKLLGSDDLLSLLATVFSAIHTGLLVLAVRNGLGQTKDDLSQDQIRDMNRCFYASNIIYTPALACAQFGVAMLILRLLRLEGSTISSLKKLAMTSYITMGGIAAWTVAGIVVFALPLGSLSGQTTSTQVTAMTAIEVLYLLFDLPLTVVPIRLIWMLHMDISKKVVILSGFMIRIFFHIIAIFRVKALESATDSSDVPFGLASAAVLMAVELNLSIVGATLPCLTTFLRMMNSGWLATTAGNATISTGNSYALKSSSRTQKSANHDKLSEEAGTQTTWPQRWTEDDGELSQGSENQYQVRVKGGGQAHDASSIASFGSRQVMISKTVEARVDTITSDSTE